jgi:hypothetical protein
MSNSYFFKVENRNSCITLLKLHSCSHRALRVMSASFSTSPANLRIGDEGEHENQNFGNLEKLFLQLRY